jgi:RNA polymerase sigma-70 factor (ECF subfamily)
LDIEHEIETACARGDFPGAATRALEHYGPELYGFIVSLMGDRAGAADAFSQFSEDLWRGLPSFAFRSSARTWLYTLARHAAFRVLRSERVRRRHKAPLSELGEVAERVRTATLPHLRSEAKDAIARLRAGLEPDDRALLVLRLDRGLAWSEVARVLAPDEEPVRAAARVRKRFQLVKDRLRVAAEAAGLVRAREDPE